jgi:hypothetical protein
MKNLGGRLRKLEDRLGVTNKQQIRLVVMQAAAIVSEENQAICIRVLEERGLLGDSAIALVNLLGVPGGLNAEEMELWARENADDMSRIVPTKDDCEGTFGRYQRLAAERAEDIAARKLTGG